MSADQRHQFIEQLGYGDFDTLHRAHDTLLQHEVAIRKIPHTDTPFKENIRLKLVSEANILSQLNHPNIVTIYEHLSLDSHDEIIMELLDGVNLSTLAKRHLLQPVDFRLVASQIISALAGAHAHNIVHADLRPANVLVCGLPSQTYVVKVINFGFSPEIRKCLSHGDTTELNLLMAPFMAPELFHSSEPTQLSDIYSLGCLLYFLLTGAYPFSGNNYEEIIAAHKNGKFTPIKELRPDVPESLCQWIHSHIRLDPATRIPSCAQSLEELLALSIHQAEGAYRLPAHPASASSRDVRPLTMQSFSTTHYSVPPLPDGSDFDPASLVKVHFSEAQLKEANKKLHPNLQRPSNKSAVPLSQRIRQVPAQEQWHFSVQGNRKGPVDFTKLCTLISEGLVKHDDLVWHPRFGEWNPVSSVPELREEVDKGIKELKKLAKEKAKAAHKPPVQQAVTQIGQSPTAKPGKPAKAAAPISHNIDDDLDAFHWIGGEFIYLIAGSLCSAIFLWYLPDLWQVNFLLFSASLLVAGLIFMRIHMNRLSRKWLAAGILLPILSDLAYTVTHPLKALRSILLWVLAAGLVHFCLAHRYQADVFVLLGYPDPITEVQNFYEDQIEQLSDLELPEFFKK